MQQNFDMQQLMKLAASPAGRQLMEALKKTGGEDARKAAALARGGDMAGAKALSSLLASEDIRALLGQLEGQL